MDGSALTGLLTATIALVGLVAWVRIQGRARAVRELAAAPRWPIAQVPEAVRARVTGQVLGPFGQAWLTAPLTGRPCVYYAVTVETYLQGTKNVPWRIVASEAVAVPFVIQDDTGRAVVHPEAHASVLVVEEWVGESRGPALTPAQRALLERHGRAHEERPGQRRRYREAVITASEVVTVLGQGTRDVDPHAPAPADYRGARATLLHLTGAPERPLVISDEPEATRSPGTHA